VIDGCFADEFELLLELGEGERLLDASCLEENSYIREVGQ